MADETDYDDDITDNVLERIRRLVPEEEFRDWPVVSGPAW